MRGTALLLHETRSHKRITPACAGNSVGLPARAADPGDHPRVCGEQRFPPPSGPGAWGSPPRVRGTGFISALLRANLRITPACAGNRTTKNLEKYAKDHPRVCGEQVEIKRPCGKPRGSPPRVRGTEEPDASKNIENRITPACAGNSSYCRYSRGGGEDHPRVCGEQCWGLRWVERMGGSPPRVRGTGHIAGSRPGNIRITPACAGNRYL